MQNTNTKVIKLRNFITFEEKKLQSSVIQSNTDTKQIFTPKKSYKATTKFTKLYNFVTFEEKVLLRKSYRVTKLGEA